jgi:hypothetical protein
MPGALASPLKLKPSPIPFAACSSQCGKCASLGQKARPGPGQGQGQGKARPWGCHAKPLPGPRRVACQARAWAWRYDVSRSWPGTARHCQGTPRQRRAAPGRTLIS